MKGNDYPLKQDFKAFSVIELLISVSLVVILLAGSTVFYIKYQKNSQLQILKNHGDMIAKALLNCMFYEADAGDCLLGILEDGGAYNLQKTNLFNKIELSTFEEPLQNLKASWDSSSNKKIFCFQFKREIKAQTYKLCVDVNRKTKVIRSVLVGKNFCCKEKNGSCSLPLRPQVEFIDSVSSNDCKNKGFSDDFFSYLSRTGSSQALCQKGTCIQ